ncbi:hypothetical protein KEJ18_00095 [Candidatus Bathyarchaeota archaeon]|nr:hypothetical protein [Candidatus Bathyarchaeota archaeon]
MKNKNSSKKVEKIALRFLTLFDEKLMEVIKDVLEKVLGEVAAGFIIEFLIFKVLKKDETYITFGEDAKIFSDALRDILGSGCVPIEKLIIEQLYLKFRLEFKEEKNYTFSDYKKELKRLLGEHGQS